MSNDYDNQFTRKAIENLRLTLGELTPEADPLAILSLAELRIRRLNKELEEAKAQRVDADGWACIRCGEFTDVCPECAVALGKLKGCNHD